ncbi:complement factor B-like isoform X2 [Lissotriton helveticus]
MTSAQHLLISICLLGHTGAELERNADASRTSPSYLKHLIPATPRMIGPGSLQNISIPTHDHLLNTKKNWRKEEKASTITTDGFLVNATGSVPLKTNRTNIIEAQSAKASYIEPEKLNNSSTIDGQSIIDNGGRPDLLTSNRTIRGHSPQTSSAEPDESANVQTSFNMAHSFTDPGPSLFNAEHDNKSATVVNSTLSGSRGIDPQLKSSLHILSTLQIPAAQPRSAGSPTGPVNAGGNPNLLKEVGPKLKLQPEDITCDENEMLQGGHIVWPQKRTVGSMLKHICPEGFRAFPVSWRVCNHLGQWSALRSPSGEKMGTALCKRVTCLRPSTFDNGFFHPKEPHYEVNSTMTFECYSGYELLGSAVRTCLPNGHWSGKLTICENHEFICPDPGIPIGGSRKGNRFGMLQTVSYTCGEHALWGSAIRECLPSGRWSGEPPLCESWQMFDSPLNLEKELQILETEVKRSAEGSADLSLNPLKNKKHNIFFVVEASASVGQENFDKGLSFIKRFTEKVSMYRTNMSFGVVLFGMTTMTVVKIEDGWRNEKVIEAINGIIYKDLRIGRSTNMHEALSEVLLSATRDPSAAAAKYTVIIITCNIIAIGIGAIQKKSLESLVVLKDTEEEGRQYTFYFPNYDDLDKVYSTPLKGTFKVALPDATGDFSQCGVQGPIVQRPMGRIFNGLPSSVGDWPWQAHIKFPGNLFCGGSVIGEKWILSAAHCFDDEEGRLLKPENVIVSVGILSTKEKQPVIVEKIVQHEMWNSTTKDYDIALLKLQTFIEYSDKVRPVCLPCVEEVKEILLPPDTSWEQSCLFQEKLLTVTGIEERERSLSGFVAGWGYFIKSVPSISLKHTKVDIQPRFRCYTRHNIRLTENMFCARGSQSDACKGDSGGPLVMKMRNRWIQVGIVSFGRYEECGSEDFMGFYTSVPRLMSWIKSKTGIK